MTIKPLLEQRLSPNIIIPYCRDRGAEQRKRNKAVHLNLIHQCRTDVQESENWIPPLVDKFKPFPARRRRIFYLASMLMAVIVCLFIRLLWLVCGVQGSHGCYIVWCLHLGPFFLFSSAAAVHGDYRLFCVQKPCLPSK